MLGFLVKSANIIYDDYFMIRMQTSSAVSAAHLLFQSAEAVLPKQKKNLAITEYKQAKVALKRHCKARQEEQGMHHSLMLNFFLS